MPTIQIADMKSAAAAAAPAAPDDDSRRAGSSGATALPCAAGAIESGAASASAAHGSISDDAAKTSGRRGADGGLSLSLEMNPSAASSLAAAAPGELAVCGGGDSARPAAVKRGRSPDLIAARSPDPARELDEHAEADRHCRQRYLMAGIIRMPPPKFVHNSDLARILRDDAPRSEYRDVPHRMRTTNHWGQRKLLLAEIEFLTMFIHDLRARSPPPKRIIVVYAGAAPGNHVPYLFDLFDNQSGDLQFALFDPADWNIESRRNEQFSFDEIALNPAESSCRNGFFTDDVARYYKGLCEAHGHVTLFISDIRTGDPKSLDARALEAAVERDMDWQQTWIRIMRPAGSMLKFRLPWGPGCTSYVKGDIYLPVWGPQTTTETRLIVREKDLDCSLLYDHLAYEERMFFFNMCSRVDYYLHDVQNLPGVDRCYDCAAEAHILKRYVTTISWPEASESDAAEEVARMMDEISEQISFGRTLASVIDVHTRKEWFEARRYDTQTFQLSLATKSGCFVEKYARPSSPPASLSQ